jgi:hypothetical protein
MKFTEWLNLKENLVNPKIVFLMRGFPGSGKSSVVGSLLNQYGGSPVGHVFATDNDFIPNTLAKRRAGEYVSGEEEDTEYNANFHVNKTQGAHIRNLIEFKKAVDQGVTPLIVDNTNITVQAMRPYAAYAEKEGYQIRTKYSNSPWWKEHFHLLSDKKTNKEKLDQFAELLATKNRHGVPAETIKDFIARWHHRPTLEDILGRKPTKKKL